MRKGCWAVRFRGSIAWNPWHGCHKVSAGCAHCYVYHMDERHEKDASKVYKTQNFNLPMRKNREGGYKIPSGAYLATCFTSDFLLEEADEWRAEAWRMMRERSDVHFFFITKRIERLEGCLPPDWGDDYENVEINCTVENQQMAERRLPILRDVPVRHKGIVCEPLLSAIDLSPYLGGWVEHVVAGGESGTQARICDYDWILDLRKQCEQADVSFYFKQTGARLKKDGKLYRIAREHQHAQARKAGINYWSTKGH